MSAQPRILGIAAILAALVTAIVTGTGNTNAEAAVVADHGQLVDETPRLRLPEVVDGIVWATIQLQDRVIVGGDFLQVQDENGVLVNQAYLFAYDINTGEMIDDFDPVLDAEVRSLEPNADLSGFYLGGRFKMIDGAFATRIGEIDYFGEHNAQFAPAANAMVHAIAANEETVFLGGLFTTVNSVEHLSLGAVDATTGANVAGFNIQAVGTVGKAGSDSVRSLDINSAGDKLLVVHAAERMSAPGDTVENLGAAIIDIPNLEVTNWQTDWYAQTYTQCSQSALQLRDGEFSPDGSYFVLVQKGNWKCDDAIAFSTVDDGDGNDPLWVTKLHDSVYSVGITDAAVYVGGHFCFVKDWGPMTVEEAVADPWENKPELCESLGGNDDVGEFDARYQFAALDPATGAAFDWEPVTNSQEGVLEITPIDRGLLVGHDRDLVGGFSVGRHAFFDFGGTTPGYVPPVVAEINCTAAVNAAGNVSLSWNEIPGISTYIVRRDGSWLASVNALNYTDTTAAVGQHTYIIRYRIADDTLNATCSPNPLTIDPQPVDELTCSAVVTAAGNVNLGWNEIPGISTYVVRRDGSWLASVNALNYTDTTAAVGQHTYIIRYRIAGDTINATCSPNPITIDGDPVDALTCAANVVGGGVSIEWNSVGAETYQVRRNGGWIGQTAGLSYLDSDGAAADNYQVRFRMNGTTTTVDCA